jgi:molybdate transport system permease protein
VTRRSPAALGWLAGLLALYLIAPFIAGLHQLALADWTGVDWSGLASASIVSVAAATTASVLIAIFGIPLGYLLARRRGRWWGLLGFLVQLPLALPPLSSGVLLLFLLGAYSPLARLVGDITDSFAGVVAAESFVAAPFLVIAARSAFAAVDPVLEDVAATLGHRRLDRFLRVSLRLAWPATRAGLLLAWLRAFGEFGATVLVAYHPYSLPVYTYVAFGAQGLPAMLPVLLPTLAAALGVMALIALWSRTETRQSAPRSETTLAPVSRAAPEFEGEAPSLAIRFTHLLGDFPLDVAWAPTGRRLAILGPSGSGKSLTLRLIAGLEQADRGSLLIGGQERVGAPAEERAIGYVPQSYGLLPDRTLMGQLLFAKGAHRADAERWIARLGLAGLEKRLPSELSLGQQQRAALARAFLCRAHLLLLDEPFSALDMTLRRQLQSELRLFQSSMRVTTVIVTHDPDEAMLLADELLVLGHGRVLQSGPVEDVFRRPAGEAVARLLGARFVAEGRAVGPNQIDIGNGVVLETAAQNLPEGVPVGWSVRPEFARIGRTGPYQGTVEDIFSLGHGAEAMVRLGQVRLLASAEPGTAIRPGPQLLAINPHAVQVWPKGAGAETPMPASGLSTRRARSFPAGSAGR